MGAALSFLGQKLFASSTLISARCENICCCTSVAAVQPPVVRRTGGFLRKGMTTIYSRKRVAGLDSDFEVDLGESLHLQSMSVAYDGNMLILNDLELRQQFRDAADYPAASPASPTKPFSVDHMLGPSFVSGGSRFLSS